MSDEAILEQLAAEPAEQIDVVAKDWIQIESEKEVKRIQNVGSSVNPLKTLNCGIIPNFDNKKAKAINRIEIDTDIDLSKIQQIMVSPAIPYPHKQHFNYVNLILVTDQPTPYLAPYLYHTNLKVTQPEKEEDGRKYPSKQIVLKNDLKDYFLINKKGICARFTIHEYHANILNRQFEASPFGKQPRSVTRLAIFDFDNTLFFSPQLSPTIWHPRVLKKAVAESLYGPGWWRDVRSMELEPKKNLEQTAWKGFWNEDIVQEARNCIEDPSTMTVVLTGRRHHPFSNVICAMLSSKNLVFDMVCLRPDPEIAPKYRWKISNNTLNYHTSPSVFHSTVHFKESFIYNLLQRVPSLYYISLWEDRIYHITNFKQYLARLKNAGMIESFKVIEAPPLRPKYNPEWEKNVMKRIMEAHNLALRARLNGATCGKLTEKDIPGDPMGECQKYFVFDTSPIGKSIQLTSESVHRLRQTFETDFKHRSKGSQYPGAEEPMFFGHSVCTDTKRNDESGEKATIKVQSTSPPNQDHWMALGVEVLVSGQSYSDVILLYYRPSDEKMLRNIKPHNWDSLDAEKQIELEGTVVEEQRIDLRSIELAIWSEGSQQMDQNPDDIKTIMDRGSPLLDDRRPRSGSDSPQYSSKKRK
ncbi:hypothetical protein BY458DRAFT_433514 [Sporodiniella umbellata]|nr:hypothetical protein BY458DRAFT_433514 [Sporodiniella umbellata]